MVRLQTRRRLLRLSGGGALVALAGCSAIGSLRRTNDSRPATESATQTDDGRHGGDGDGSHDESLDGPAPEAEVAMTTTDGESHFEPHVVWVEAGGTVTWRLESGSHSATAYHPDNSDPRRIPQGAAAWDSSVVSEQGVTFEHTFEPPGVYDYFCRPHESVGMVGSVLVGRPDDGGPGLAAPQSDLPAATAEKVRSLNQRATTALGGGGSGGHGTGTSDSTDAGNHDH